MTTLELLRQRASHIARNPGQAVARMATHALVRAQTGDRVVSGPFAGMWYGLPVPHLPAFLGTYELELAPLLERLRATAFDPILNVGAADGYYAAGLARLWPRSRVVAFELSAAKQANARRVVERNQLGDRVEVTGVCTVARLEELLRGGERPLVWMDVDGAEDELLDPAAVPSLARAEVVVELHEFLIGGIGHRLRDRFAVTHETEVIEGQRRGPGQFPLTGPLWRSALGRRAAREALQERRPERQDWLYLHPLA